MVSVIKRVVYSALYAVIISFLYERYVAFAPLWANRPGKLVEVQQHVGETRTSHRNGVRNCEDVLLLEDSGFAILSCDEGRDRWNTVMGTFRTDLHIPSGKLYLYDYTQQDSPGSSLKTIALEKFEHADDFHPLGIEYDGATSTLYVVNHAASGSCIEIFTVDLASATATHVRTFKHDLIHTPNSIHSIGNGRLYVTNDHYFRAATSLILSKIESFSGVPGGTVTYVDINDPQSARVVAHVPFANGITMLNSTTLAVGSPSKPGVFFYKVVEADHSLLLKNVVRAPASVDNLSVDSAGVLLMAGHPDPFRLEHVTRSRFACVPGSEDEKERRACECVAPSYVAEWTEEGGLQTFYQGMGFCSSTTFVRDTKRRIGLVTGLYDRGVLEFRA